MSNERNNLLILSCGTRNKVVKYFKNALNGRGKVFATDCSEYAPALYEADQHFLVPRINEENYLETILDICEKNNIKGMLSLIDPELLLIAENIEKFESIGVKPMISSYDVVEITFDKFKFQNLLKNNGFNYIKSYIDIDSFKGDLQVNNISFPVFVKPICGSASININVINDMQELELLFSKYDDLMIQEMVSGQEYGIDAYVDLYSGEMTSIFMKKKLLMRAGETDKSESIWSDEIFDIVNRFTQLLDFKGVLDIDIFERDGLFYISEVNPRFGGGYPHAYELGVDFPKLYFENLEGKTTQSNFNSYEKGKFMLKYNELLIL